MVLPRSYATALPHVFKLREFDAGPTPMAWGHFEVNMLVEIRRRNGRNPADPLQYFRSDQSALLHILENTDEWKLLHRDQDLASDVPTWLKQRTLFPQGNALVNGSRRNLKLPETGDVTKKCVKCKSLTTLRQWRRAPEDNAHVICDNPECIADDLSALQEADASASTVSTPGIATAFGQVTPHKPAAPKKPSARSKPPVSTPRGGGTRSSGDAAGQKRKHDGARSSLQPKPKRTSGKGSFPCPVAKEYNCSQMFTQAASAKRHADNAHLGLKKEVTYLCPFADEVNCTRSFTNHRNAKLHAKSKHPERVLPCPMAARTGCDELFMSVGEAEAHADLEHRGARSFPCPCADRLGCPSTFTSSAIARRHARTVHGVDSKVPDDDDESTGSDDE